MGRVLEALGHRLPPSVTDRLRRSRGPATQLTVGVQLLHLRADLARLRRAVHKMQRDQQALTNDLLERQDLVLAGYDRRVAALVVRLLDVEDKLGTATAGGDDANAVLAGHDHPAPALDAGEST